MSAKPTIPRPTKKLVTAVVCMSAVMLFHTYDLASSLETSNVKPWHHLINVSLCAWFLGHGSFKNPTLQILYGYLFAALGLFVGIFAGIVDSVRIVSMSGSMNLLLMLGCLTPAFLLIFDRDIVRYRRWLRVQSDQRCRLDPKVDILPDDSINLP